MKLLSFVSSFVILSSFSLGGGCTSSSTASSSGDSSTSVSVNTGGSNSGFQTITSSSTTSSSTTPSSTTPTVPSLTYSTGPADLSEYKKMRIEVPVMTSGNYEGDTLLKEVVDYAKNFKVKDSNRKEVKQEIKQDSYDFTDLTTVAADSALKVMGLATYSDLNAYKTSSAYGETVASISVPTSSGIMRHNVENRFAYGNALRKTVRMFPQKYGSSNSRYLKLDHITLAPTPDELIRPASGLAATKTGYRVFGKSYLFDAEYRQGLPEPIMMFLAKGDLTTDKTTDLNLYTGKSGEKADDFAKDKFLGDVKTAPSIEETKHHMASVNRLMYAAIQGSKAIESKYPYTKGLVPQSDYDKQQDRSVISKIGTIQTAGKLNDKGEFTEQKITGAKIDQDNDGERYNKLDPVTENKQQFTALVSGGKNYKPKNARGIAAAADKGYTRTISVAFPKARVKDKLKMPEFNPDGSKKYAFLGSTSSDNGYLFLVNTVEIGTDPNAHYSTAAKFEELVSKEIIDTDKSDEGTHNRIGKDYMMFVGGVRIPFGDTGLRKEIKYQPFPSSSATYSSVFHLNKIFANTLPIASAGFASAQTTKDGTILKMPVYAGTFGITSSGEDCGFASDKGIKSAYGNSCVVVPDRHLVYTGNNSADKNKKKYYGVNSLPISMKIMGYALDDLILRIGKIKDHGLDDSSTSSYLTPQEVSHIAARSAIPIVSISKFSNANKFGDGLFNAYSASRYALLFANADRQENAFFKGNPKAQANSDISDRYTGLYAVNHEYRARNLRAAGNWGTDPNTKVGRAIDGDLLPFEYMGDLGKFVGDTTAASATTSKVDYPLNKYLIEDLMKDLKRFETNVLSKESGYKGTSADKDKYIPKRIGWIKDRLHNQEYIMGLIGDEYNDGLNENALYNIYGSSASSILRKRTDYLFDQSPSAKYAPIGKVKIEDLPWLLNSTRPHGTLWDYVFTRGLYTPSVDNSSVSLSRADDGTLLKSAYDTTSGNYNHSLSSKKLYAILAGIAFPSMQKKLSTAINANFEIDGQSVTFDYTLRKTAKKVSSRKSTAMLLLHDFNQLSGVSYKPSEGALPDSEMNFNNSFSTVLRKMSNSLATTGATGEKKSSLMVIPYPYKGVVAQLDDTKMAEEIEKIQDVYNTYEYTDFKTSNNGAAAAQVDIKLPVVSVTFNPIYKVGGATRFVSDDLRSADYINEDKIAPVSLQCKGKCLATLSAFAGPFLVPTDYWKNPGNAGLSGQVGDDGSKASTPDDGLNKFMSVTSIGAGGMYVATMANKLGRDFGAQLNSAQIRELMLLSAIPIGRKDPKTGQVFRNAKYGRGLANYSRAFALGKACLAPMFKKDQIMQSEWGVMCGDKSLIEQWGDEKTTESGKPWFLSEDANAAAAKQKKLGRNLADLAKKAQKELAEIKNDPTVIGKKATEDKLREKLGNIPNEVLIDLIAFSPDVKSELDKLSFRFAQSKHVLNGLGSGGFTSPSVSGFGAKSALHGLGWVSRALRSNWLTNANLGSFVNTGSRMLGNLVSSFSSGLKDHTSTKINTDKMSLSFSANGSVDDSMFAVNDVSALAPSFGRRTALEYKMNDGFGFNFGYHNLAKHDYKGNIVWGGMSFGAFNISAGHMFEDGGMLGGQTTGVFGKTDANTWFATLSAQTNLGNTGVKFRAGYTKAISRWYNKDFISGSANMSGLNASLEKKLNNVHSIGFGFKQSLKIDSDNMILNRHVRSSGKTIGRSDRISLVPVGQERLYEVVWKMNYSSDAYLSLWGVAATELKHNVNANPNFAVGLSWASKIGNSN